MDTNLSTYEIRLRQEFYNLQKVQRKATMKEVIKIEYMDRMNKKRCDVLIEPSSNQLYPEEYFVTYTLPVYVGRGRLKKDWSGEFKFKVSSEVLMNRNSQAPTYYELDIRNGIPFNQHVYPNTGLLCLGGVWSISKSFGLWYFIAGVGGLLNQDSISMSDDGKGHYNKDAYEYWKIDRKKQPINKIDWVYTLDELKIGKKPTPQKTLFKVAKKEKPRKFTIGDAPKYKPSFKIKKD